VEERKLLERFAAGAPPSANADGYFTALALVGGAPAGAVVQKLLESRNVDVRAAAAETFSHAIFNEAAVAALATTATDPSAKVRRATIRALAVNANWRSEAAQKALIELANNPGKAVDARYRIDAVDGIVQAVRFQVKGVRQDPPMFRALVALLDDKDDELRVMAANTLAPIRDSGYRGDLGRPERKTPDGGWAIWLNEISAKAAGYSKDYEVCGAGNRGSKDSVDLYCMGGSSLRTNPALGFKYTLQAAEQGYVPAEAAIGMMYANGKGVQQNYSEAAKWWTKAAEGGHVLAATNVSMLYRGVAGVPSDPAMSEKWAKFATERGSRVAAVQ
nr:HEAT repeat domain-containing protein [Acidobacteriota bacterium]